MNASTTSTSPISAETYSSDATRVPSFAISSPYYASTLATSSATHQDLLEDDDRNSAQFSAPDPLASGRFETHANSETEDLPSNTPEEHLCSSWEALISRIQLGHWARSAPTASPNKELQLYILSETAGADPRIAHMNQALSSYTEGVDDLDLAGYQRDVATTTNRMTPLPAPQRFLSAPTEAVSTDHPTNSLDWDIQSIFSDQIDGHTGSSKADPMDEDVDMCGLEPSTALPLERARHSAHSFLSFDQSSDTVMEYMDRPDPYSGLAAETGIFGMSTRDSTNMPGYRSQVDSDEYETTMLKSRYSYPESYEESRSNDGLVHSTALDLSVDGTNAMMISPSSPDTFPGVFNSDAALPRPGSWFNENAQEMEVESNERWLHVPTLDHSTLTFDPIELPFLSSPGFVHSTGRSATSGRNYASAPWSPGINTRDVTSSQHSTNESSKALGLEPITVDVVSKTPDGFTKDANTRGNGSITRLSLRDGHLYGPALFEDDGNEETEDVH